MWRALRKGSVFFAGFVCLAGCFAARPLTPRLIPTDGVLLEEFVHLAAGSEEKRTFLVANPGPDPLGLKVVGTSCPCLVSPTSGVITAGQTLAFRVRVDTRELQGRVHLTAEFDTTDSEKPRLQLVLVGDVLPPVEVDPPVVYFGQVRSGTSEVRLVRITPARPDVRIRRISSVRGGLGLQRAAEMPSAPTADGSLVVEVRLPPNLGPGGFAGELLVRTDDPLLPNYPVPVLAIILAN